MPGTRAAVLGGLLLLAGRPADVVAQAMAPVEVAETVIASDIVERQPADTIDVIAADAGTVYCWTRITGAEREMTVEHVWYFGEREMARVPLRVAGADWRTWSSKRLTPEWTGDWRVDIVGADGDVLRSVSFSVR